MHADLGSLENAIGHRFADREILRRALTHSSHAYEQCFPGSWLVRHFPGYSEGRLSRIKAHLVSAAHLGDVAHTMGLGKYLLLGRGEEQSGGRLKRNVISDALEALMGALYLDGGLEAARLFVHEWIIGDAVARPELLEELPERLLDFKGALQELARRRKLPLPRYIVIQESGPHHSRLFTIEVRVGPSLSACGQGYTKKSASQDAARQVYERLLASFSVAELEHPPAVPS